MKQKLTPLQTTLTVQGVSLDKGAVARLRNLIEEQVKEEPVPAQLRAFDAAGGLSNKDLRSNEVRHDTSFRDSMLPPGLWQIYVLRRIV